MTGNTQTPAWRVSTRMRSRAKALRRDMTKAERALWYMLRAHRMAGVGFKRQKPIGPYIVDSVSLLAKLVIEVDGGQHFEDAGMAADRRRDRYLASKGYKVLRFNNHDVLINRSGVAKVILAEIENSPSLTLPRMRGREDDAVPVHQQATESTAGDHPK